MDRAVKRAIKKAGDNKLQTVWGSTLYHRDDVPYAPDMSDLPDGFTPFRNKAESRAAVRDPLPPPSKGALPLPAAGIEPGSSPSAATAASDSAAAAGGAACTIAPEAFAFEPTLDHLPFATVEEHALAKLETHPQSVLPFVGGESAALARVEYYVWESERIATYFETRNG